MRAIRYTSRFKRDYRREKSGILGKKLDKLLTDAVNLLAGDEPLPQRYVDHPLAGEWKDHRDCHIRPDLVLIYRKPDADSLELVRLGSHSELGISFFTRSGLHMFTISLVEQPRALCSTRRRPVELARSAG